MEPNRELNNPNNKENLPLDPPIANPEQNPESGGYEVAPENKGEVSGVKINQISSPPPQAPLNLPPLNKQPANNTPTPQADAGATGLIADDVDVIEKEWVKKAEQIIHQTKDDPHAQEEEVSKLQKSYLKSRYNKELKQEEQ